MNIENSKVMGVTKSLENENQIGGNMEEVNVFGHFRVDMSTNAALKDKMNHRVDKRRRLVVLKYLWKEES